MKRQGSFTGGLLSAVLVGFGIAYGLWICSGYRKGQQEYSDLADRYTTVFDEAGADGEDMGSQEKLTSESRETEEEKDNQSGSTGTGLWRPLTDPLPSDAPERLCIDFASLKKENKDVMGWISMPAIGISYPVLQADDNEYYLHRDIHGEYLFAGSIFMDEFCSSSLYGYNTVIYGHNMRDGSMFAGLWKFQNEETLKNCRYFWIYTPEADCLYEICSIHPAASGTDTFTVRFSDYEVHISWLQEMERLSSPQTGVRLEADDRIVTLSTCTNNSAVRMTVQGKLVWREDKPK